MNMVKNKVLRAGIICMLILSLLIPNVGYNFESFNVEGAEEESYSLGTVYSTSVAKDWESDVEVITEKSEWKYRMSTSNDITNDWNSVDFDDSNWDTALAPFGDRDNYATSWTGNNNYIWIRKSFTIDDVSEFEGSRMELITFYDDNPKFYLNGNLVYQDDSGNQWTDGYEFRDLGTECSKYLVQGENVIAIQCSNDTGGRQIDTSVTFVKKKRDEFEIFGTREEWKYLISKENDAPVGWNEKDFDDSSWKTSLAPFGDRADFQTSWTGDDDYIWIRKKFEVDNLSDFEGYILEFNTFYDDNPKFYLNGQLVYSDGGWVDSYTRKVLKDYMTEYLVEGENVIAIQCSNDTGGRQIDTGLSATKLADKDTFWQDVDSKEYGIYAVKGLQDTQIEYGIMDASLVQSDVIGTNDTYEVIFEPGNNLYFYFNPRMGGTDVDNNVYMWSQGDENWGATSYDESIVKYIDKQQATVKYKFPMEMDFGDKDFVTTQIGCQVYNNTDFKDGVLKDDSKPLITIYFNLRVLKNRGIFIDDTIKDNGSINVRNPQNGKKYVWEKSSDGISWESVAEKRYDLDVITNSGQTLNVAIDLGGGMYYRVREVNSTQWSYPYKVPYYNNIQNGDFEVPAMYMPGESGASFPFNTFADEQQYPNGFPGLNWKTTGPGWMRTDGSYRVTCDIEIVNGRRLKTNSSAQQSSFSVSLTEMYVDGKDDIDNGDQFAELNCENVGALYQDMLTMPKAECYWELDHAGRFAQNSMYVVVMSVKDGELYSDSSKIDDIVAAAKNANIVDSESEFETGTEIVLEGGVHATVWKVTSPEKEGIWKHHSGKYNVPDGESNYLTRFFFVSTNDDGDQDPTVGNLLDNVTFDMHKEYSIKYYVEDEMTPVHTINGVVDPYERVEIPSTIEQADLSKYTLYKVRMNGRNYYLDDAQRLMTVAYGNDDLELYYKESVIALNKLVEGLDEIPNGYQLKFELSKTDGTVLETKILGKDDFTKLEQLNDDDAVRYFTTITFSGMDYSLNEGEQLIIKESIKTTEGSHTYLQQVDVDGTLYNLDLFDYAFTSREYQGKLTYFTQSANEITFVNKYVVAYDIYVTKKVTGDLYDLGYDKNKEFDFEINVKDKGQPADAFMYLANVKKLSYGKFGFSLTNNAMTYVIAVKKGCDIEIAEKDYGSIYSTKWEETSSGLKGEGKSFVVEDINADTYITCTNNSVFDGDVEVQGFQMNTDNSEGAVSEHNPSFRVVSRACKMLRGTDGKLHYVKNFGTIYALDSSVKGNYNSMRLENAYDAYDTSAEVNQDSIFYLQATDEGIYQGWTTRQDDNEYYNYFAVTFVMRTYTYRSLESDMAFRAYAVLDTGEIIYGKKIYSVNMYKIAENLYKNRKVGSKAGHDFLYTNVLNLVTMDKNRVSICTAMLKALNVSDKTSDDYKMINAVNHDINDYVYCQKDYKYEGRKEFLPNSTDASLLLTMLNASRKTNYNTLFDWIYNETGKLGYNGYYKKVPYDWDDGIYNGFNMN